jgi:hypothetical protein
MAFLEASKVAKELFRIPNIKKPYTATEGSAPAANEPDTSNLSSLEALALFIRKFLSSI